jgi:predicted alpha/beta superfamily hydrolase
MQKLRLLYSILITLLSTSFSGIGQNMVNIKEAKPLAIGEQLTVFSEYLKEDRVLNVYLPHGYSPDSTKVYPVIYLLDGSMHEDFLHIVGIVQFGSYSWINFIPESIVVGISNVDRKRDFTFPNKRQAKQKQSRHSGQFIAFIDHELMPLINSRYKTTSESTVIGQSLGGLLATEILIRKPHVFTNYIIISPSLWWDNSALLKEDPVYCLSKKKIYIAVGKEGRIMEQSAKVLYENLIELNRPSLTVYYDYFDELDHSNILHLGVYRAFQTVFKPVKS